MAKAGEIYEFNNYGDNRITLVNVNDDGTKQFHIEERFSIEQDNVKPGKFSEDDVVTFIIPEDECIQGLINDIAGAIGLPEADTSNIFTIHGDLVSIPLTLDDGDRRRPFFRTKELFDDLGQDAYKVTIKFDFDTFFVDSEGAMSVIFEFNSCSIEGNHSSREDGHRRMIEMMMAARMRNRIDIKKVLAESYVPPIEDKDSKLNSIFEGNISVGFELEPDEEETDGNLNS